MKTVLKFVAAFSTLAFAALDQASAQTVRLAGNSTLVITGSSLADTVTVTKNAEKLLVNVTNSSKTISSEYLLASVKRLRASLGPGNDSFDARTMLIQCTVYGEEGRDKIIGGRVNDILDGGFGRDAVLGGSGADSVSGNAAEDMLVGGTLFSPTASLNEILNTWLAPTDDFATRIQNLQNLSVTVVNDGRTDTLYGRNDVSFSGGSIYRLDYSATADGSQLVPSVDTTATADIVAEWNLATETLTCDVAVANLDPNLFTGATLSSGLIGASGDLIGEMFVQDVQSDGAGGFTFFAEISIPGDFFDDVLFSETYITLTTNTNPEGLIRGQLLDSTPDLLLGEPTDIYRDLAPGIDLSEITPPR